MFSPTLPAMLFPNPPAIHISRPDLGKARYEVHKAR